MSLACIKGADWKACLLMLTREGYRKVMDKLSSKAKSKVNEFLSELSFLKSWGQNRLMGLQQSLEQKTYLLN